ncbi:peptidase inhibitor family I36 protein [Streptomyces sp. NPDC094438]|uniref:peptidase inhibitor family I36 protein n=1 Tax=Streptomyces sp. NPDC094438 TaxID=3366061 RepID=UPI0037F72892
MKIRSRMAATVAALAMAAAGAVTLGSGTASAAVTPQAQQCVSGYYCVWSLDSYEGSRYTFKDTNYSWRGYGAWHNDQSSWNSGTSGMGVYLLGSGGRHLGCLPKGHGWWHHNPANTGEGNAWTWNC